MELFDDEIIVAEVTDKGWVARDKDGSLWFFKREPKREENFLWIKGTRWYVEKGWKVPIHEKYFPQVTWESEPLEATISVKIE